MTEHTTKHLGQLAVDDVIVDVQGRRHLITGLENYTDEDGPGLRIFTDTYPAGREVTPVSTFDSVLFNVEVAA